MFFWREKNAMKFFNKKGGWDKIELRHLAAVWYIYINTTTPRPPETMWATHHDAAPHVRSTTTTIWKCTFISPKGYKKKERKKENLTLDRLPFRPTETRTHTTRVYQVLITHILSVSHTHNTLKMLCLNNLKLCRLIWFSHSHGNLKKKKASWELLLSYF